MGRGVYAASSHQRKQLTMAGCMLTFVAASRQSAADLALMSPALSRDAATPKSHRFSIAMYPGQNAPTMRPGGTCEWHL